MSRASSYARMFSKAGQKVTLRRIGEADCIARARVRRDGADELIGGLDQAIRTIIVLAADVTFSSPLRRGDEVITAAGDHLTIEICDADTHKFGDELLAYILTVKG